MHSVQPSLFTRSDTILGACEGIGEDFGFNPQILRVALAAMLFWSPVAAIAAYAAIALVVLVSRYIFPNPVLSPAAAAPALAPSGNDDQPMVLAAAA